MSQPATTPEPQPSRAALRVARGVIDAISELTPATGIAVQQAIRSIGEVRGRQIPLQVPDAPEGAQFYALAPADRSAPAVIYRALQPGEGEGWRVTALMSRDAYEQVAAADDWGLLHDPDTLAAVSRATSTAISTMGTITATPGGTDLTRGS